MLENPPPQKEDYVQFILRWVITSLAVSVAVWIVPGIVALGQTWVAVMLVGLVLTIINMSIKPLFQTLSLPFTCLTFGVFALVVNAVMFELSSWLATSLFHTGIYIEDFLAAFLGALIVSITSVILNALTGNIANE